MKYVVLAASVLALALVGATSGKAAYIAPTVASLQKQTTAWINKRFAFLHENFHVLSTRCMAEDNSGQNFYCAVRLWSAYGPFGENYNVTYNPSTGNINWSGSAG
jgi:hypothetical protein